MFGMSQQDIDSGIISQSNFPTNKMGFATGPKTGIAENWEAAVVAGKFADSFYAYNDLINANIKDRANQIQQLTGKRIEHDYVFPELNAAVLDDNVEPSKEAYSFYKNSWLPGAQVSKSVDALKKARDSEREIEELRKQYPQIKSFQQLIDDAKGTAKMLREQQEDVSSRSSTMGAIGGLIGGIQGEVNENNPATLYTLPIGGFGKTVFMRIGTEALTQMGIEYVNQFHFIKKERELYGDTFSPERAAENVLFAGAGAALFRGAFEITPPLANAVRAKALQTSAKIDELATKDSRIGRIAARIKATNTPDEAAQILRSEPTEAMQSFIEAVDDNPIERARVADIAVSGEIALERALPRGVDWNQHVSNANQVNDALERGDPLPELTPARGNTIGNSLPAIPVRDLKVDAERFQFKGGGDDRGVTQRLSGVQDWNPELAGNIVVWEAADGTRYVADGHQRTGLATRLMNEKPELNIRIPAYVYREVDGITALEARYRAAIKNIGEGTGDALDTAKVFRYGDKERIDKVMRSLSPNQANVRQGQALARLGDEAFMIAETTDIPLNYSSLVADLTNDEAKQAAMMRLLMQAEPENAFVAENIMRQALTDDFSEETTSDLFGEVTSMVPLYTDKAKVLDKALKIIGKEKSALSNLVRNDDIVQAFGNTLNIDATQQGLDMTKALQTIVQKQAFVKGPIADLLTQAAKEVQNGTSHTAAARGFTRVLREQITPDWIRGVVSGTAGELKLQGKSFGEIAGIEQQNLFREAVENSAPMGEPKAIEARYADFKEAAGQVEIPASAKASGETSPASQRIDNGALEGSQDVPVQLTMRSKLSPTFSTAKISPSNEKGGFAKIGEVDAATGKRILHKLNDVKPLLKQAEKTIEPLKTWLTNLSSEINGIEFVGARVKDTKKLTDKAKILNRPANQISDYLGARVTFDSMKSMREFMAKFEGEAKIIDKEDFLQSGMPASGYRAIHLQALTKDGFSYELQIMPKTIYDVYEEGRAGYAKWKTLRENFTPEQRIQATADLAKDKEIYESAWKKFTDSEEGAVSKVSKVFKIDESAANIERQFATIDPNEQLPIDGFAVKYENGKEVSEFKTIRDLLTEIDEYDAIAKAATECLL
jgi:hypothetical protein